MFLHDKIDLFSGRNAKFYYIIFNLIAITIIVYIAVDIFYKVMPVKYVQTDNKTVDFQVMEEETPSKKSSLSDYQTIFDRNIFSKVDVSAQKGDVDVDELKNTSLKLALLGTIAGNRKTSAAIIQDKGARTQGLYREGDSILGATIKSIMKNKVILAIGKRDEVLLMEGPEAGGTGMVSGTSQVEVAAETSPAATAAVERNMNIKRSDVEASLKDLNELLSQASIQPHSTDGEPDGLTITGIKAGSIFRKMGLRNGDIIKGVNNDPIKTTEDMISMYNDLKSAPDISLQITRRGQERSFNYNFTD
jgi:general secretion pathway protein C